MESLGNLPDAFLAEVAGQPQALWRATAALSGQRDALTALAKSADRFPVFTGMGASYHAGYPAVDVLASRGKMALHVDAAELLHFRRPILNGRTLLVAVSQSGRSAEVVRLAQDLHGRRSRPLLVAISNGLDNPLAGLADLALDTQVGEETGPSSMTLVASLAVLSAVAGILGGETVPEVLRRVETGADRAARAAGNLLEAPVALAEDLADRLGSRASVVLLGRGPGRAAAEAGALIVKEVAALPVESLSTAQFRHGPLELAGDSLAAMVLATEPQTSDLDVGLAAELAEAGSSVVVVSASGHGPPGTLGVAVGDVEPSLAPAVSIVPIQLLAWCLAGRRGRIPGCMTRATKVTTRE